MALRQTTLTVISLALLATVGCGSSDTQPGILFEVMLPEHKGKLRENVFGLVGTRFRTPASGSFTVTHVGFYDDGQDGLNLDHAIVLFTDKQPAGDGAEPQKPTKEIHPTELFRVVVPYGAGTHLERGYRWTPLPKPLLLPKDEHLILAAEVFKLDGDRWPDQQIPKGNSRKNAPFQPDWNSNFVDESIDPTMPVFLTLGGKSPSWKSLPGSKHGGYGAANLAFGPVSQ